MADRVNPACDGGSLPLVTPHTGSGNSEGEPMPGAVLTGGSAMLSSTEPFNTWAALLACSIVGLACAAIVDATPFRRIAARCLRFCGWCLLTCVAVVGAAFVAVEALLTDED